MIKIRKILQGISLTAAMFVFQACYGTMGDYYDTQVTFRVVSAETGEPLEGVTISSSKVEDENDAVKTTEYTDEEGLATIWTTDGMEHFVITDKDSLYIPADTTFNPTDVDTIDIVLRKAK